MEEDWEKGLGGLVEAGRMTLEDTTITGGALILFISGNGLFYVGF